MRIIDPYFFGNAILGPYVALSSVDASNDTSIDLATAFTAPYNSFQIFIRDLIPQTDSVELRMRLSTDSSTFDTSAIYEWSQFGVRSGSGAIGTAVGTAFTYIKLAGGVSNDAGDNLNGFLTVFNSISSSNKKSGYFRNASITNNNATLNMTTTGWGYLNTAAITGIQFYMSSGNITSGNFLIAGIDS